MMRAEERTEAVHAVDARVDALLVEVVAEQVDAVGTGQIVDGMTVEVGDGSRRPIPADRIDPQIVERPRG